MRGRGEDKRRKEEWKRGEEMRKGGLRTKGRDYLRGQGEKDTLK